MNDLRARWACSFLVLFPWLAACATEHLPQEESFHTIFPSNVGPSEAQLVQRARPTVCPGVKQPAIVDFEGPARVPVWSCLAPCQPGFEYVTNVTPSPPPYSPLTELAPRCQPVCAAGTHRLSYADFEFEGHCAAGPATGPGQAEALSAEQARIRADHDRREAEALAPLDGIESSLRELGTTSVASWSDAIFQRYRDVQRGLDDVEQAFRQINDFHPDPKSAGALRIADDKTRVSAFYMAVRAELRRRGYQRGDRLGFPGETSRARCLESCEFMQKNCSVECKELPEGACDACRQEVDTCRAKCGA